MQSEIILMNPDNMLKFAIQLGAQLCALDTTTLLRLRAFLGMGNVSQVPYFEELKSMVDNITESRLLDRVPNELMVGIINGVLLRTQIMTIPEEKRFEYGLVVRDEWGRQPGCEEECIFGRVSEIPSVGETGSENNSSHDQILFDDESLPVS